VHHKGGSLSQAYVIVKYVIVQCQSSGRFL